MDNKEVSRVLMKVLSGMKSMIEEEEHKRISKLWSPISPNSNLKW
jgi:hypothetical protein